MTIIPTNPNPEDRAAAFAHVRAIVQAAIDVAIARQEMQLVQHRDDIAITELVHAGMALQLKVDALTVCVIEAQLSHDAKAN
jgi:hypothetical protein